MLPPIHLFDRIITGYGIAVSVGLLVCLIYIMRQAKRILHTDGDALLILAVAGGSALLGSHILYGIITLINHGSIPTISSFNGFLQFIVDCFGGSIFYGGLIGGTIGAFITLRVIKVPWYPMIDLLSTVVPLFHFFGRIGCFLGGCCFGIPSEFGFTMHYSVYEAANGVSRFPVQLVEASWNLLIFVLLYNLLKAQKLRGKLFFLYLVCYSPARFLLEFLRGDSYRGLWFNHSLSTSQIIALFTLTAGIIGLIFSKNNYNENLSNKELKHG